MTEPPVGIGRHAEQLKSTGETSRGIEHRFVRLVCGDWHSGSLSSTVGGGIGSVAVRATAQNCRCMRIIQFILIERMMAKEY